MAQEPFDTESLLRKNAEKLRDLLESITLHGEGEHEATIENVCRVSVAVTTACAELRQHQKAAKRALKSYSTDEIVEYLKSLPEKTRQDVCRELLGTDNEEPLL